MTARRPIARLLSCSPLLAIPVALLAGCSSGGGIQTRKIVGPDLVTVVLGDSALVAASVVDPTAPPPDMFNPDGGPRAPTFASLTPDIVTVSPAGMAHGVAIGVGTLNVVSGALTKRIGVDVVGHPAGTVASSGVVGIGPAAIAVGRDGVAVIALAGEGAVALASAPDFGAPVKVSVAAEPVAVVIGPDDIAYVVSRQGKSVTAVSTARRAVVGSAALPAPGVAVVVAAGFLWVATADDTVRQFTLPKLTAGAVAFAGAAPSMLAAANDSRELYVVSHDAKTITRLATASRTIAASDPVSGNPVGIAVARDGSRAYVPYADGTFDVFNLDPLLVTAVFTKPEVTLNIGGTAGGVAIAPDQRVVLITSPSARRIVTYSTVTRTISASLDVPGTPAGIGFTRLGDRATITDSGGTLIVIR